MRYLKIGSIIFEIDLCEDSNNFELDDRIINPEYALYQTNKFIILNYHHIANNNITVNELNMCLMYLYINTLKDNLINDNVINFFKNHYNVYKIDDFINKEITRYIYYFKSYERAFNFRFIYDKQYELFKNGYSGTYRNWTSKGELLIEFYHINGKIEGEYINYLDKINFINDINISGGYTSSVLHSLEHYLLDYE